MNPTETHEVAISSFILDYFYKNFGTLTCCTSLGFPVSHLSDFRHQSDPLACEGSDQPYTSAVREHFTLGYESTHL